MTSSAATTATLLLCAAPLLGGCYVHRPAPDPPPPGTQVRVGLAEGEAARDAAAPDAGRRGEELEGTLVAVDDGTLVLVRAGNASARRMRRPRAPGMSFAGDTLRLDRSRVARIEERRLSSTRTALMAGGILAAAALVVEASGRDDGSSAHPRDGEDPAKTLLTRLLGGIF